MYPDPNRFDCGGSDLYEPAATYGAEGLRDATELRGSVVVPAKYGVDCGCRYVAELAVYGE
jgi:hypothetical protein